MFSGLYLIAGAFFCYGYLLSNKGINEKAENIGGHFMGIGSLSLFLITIAKGLTMIFNG